MYSFFANVFGLPSTQIPAGLNKKGLPIGFQVYYMRFFIYKIYKSHVHVSLIQTNKFCTEREKFKYDNICKISYLCS